MNVFTTYKTVEPVSVERYNSITDIDGKKENHFQI